ncbi:type II toxin-antitoxin system RelE/ParE family toxin [Lactiplantibacillus songbeiensis]|uniref:Type II toxin-antitoxin system RelE/ParE family toxin n=1 Tax=Lactiplantibacillus songbeiensis TaxID=2559920 RepID=A0ABW4C159_9LACO|nr:type II toxin-antitoxin system RelE/ParE family toxin [Lactiplantibacillus songbeiensis]
MKLAYNIQPSRLVKNYLKKLKDPRLKQYFVDIIYQVIAINPTAEIEKSGDLHGIYVQTFKYHGTSYHIAYVINDATTVLLLVAGSHENFYAILRRYYYR